MTMDSVPLPFVLMAFSRLVHINTQFTLGIWVVFITVMCPPQFDGILHKLACKK